MSATDPVYNPDTPAIAQNDDWSCAITSARWAMFSYGRAPTEQWIESTAIAEGVESKALGLMDATGAGLAGFIAEQYGEFGYGAYNVAFVTFDDVTRVAGKSPVLIGGRDWSHWTGVRRYDPSIGVLELANPADHYMNVGQTLDRQQFAALGAFSMVVITWGDAAPPDQSARIAALQQQVATLTAERDSLVSRLGYVRGDVADALQAAVNTLRGLGTA